MKMCFCSRFLGIISGRKGAACLLTETKCSYLLLPAPLSAAFYCFQKNPLVMGKELDKKHRTRASLIQKDIFLSLDVKAMALFVNNET